MSQPFAVFLRRSVLLPLMATGLLYSATVLAQQPQTAPPAQPQGPPAQQQGTAPAPGPFPHLAEEKVAEAQALGFVGALDQGRYDAAYAYTSSLLRSSMDAAKFAAEVKKDRDVAGAMQSRRLLDASYTTTLRGAPTGEYVVLQYGTAFAQKPSGLETITMSYERGYWRVAGWFLK